MDELLVKEPSQPWNGGGDWTVNKIEILVEYARAYLKIMKSHPYWKKLYFDGFAGSGFILDTSFTGIEKTLGAAMRIVEITDPISFDEFYFVEKEQYSFDLLNDNIKNHHIEKTIYIVREDCNIKLKSLADFLRTKKGKNYKVLAYIDPCGMQLNWDSIENLKDLSIDLWILVPTGMGVNRLLKNNGEISDAWLEKLEFFLGMERKDIIDYFYKKNIELTLFGEESIVSKEKDTIDKSAILYKKRLNDIFKFVSDPFIMKNSTNSSMYHFFMATKNQNAYKIANDIIKKYNNKEYGTI